MKYTLLFLIIISSAFAYNYHGCALAPDNLHGWVVCIDTILIIHTTDGGTTWQPQQNLPDTVRRFFDVTCVDQYLAWTCGILGEILHTDNGGLDWYQQVIGFSKYGTRIEFIDEYHGWAAGGDGALAMTTDGGGFWEQIFTNWAANEYYGISFVNQWDGWMVAGYPDSMLTGQGFIVRSTDGGLTWDSLYQSLTYEDFFDVHFFNVFDGIIVGGDEADTSVIILKTTDGGLSWNPISAPANSYYLRAVDFVGDEGWAVGRFGTIIHTTNGGNSWYSQDNPTITEVTIISPDGGENWISGSNHQITWSTTGGTLFDVDFSDNLHGIACGYNTLLYTTNGGQNWISSDPTGLGVAYFRLLYSTDGGNSYLDTIANNISLDSVSWYWTLPVINSGTCRVKIQALNDSNNVVFEDVSNANFSISIYPTITSPNGGETWFANSTHPITWSVIGSGFTDQRLLLSIDGGINYSDTIATNISPDSSSWNWTLPSINSTTCRVKVQLLNASNNVISEDVSNGNFSIIQVNPHIQISANQHDFGVVEINEYSDWLLTVWNSGDAELVIDSIKSDSNAFAVFDPTFPQTINAGDSLLITIRFSPTEARGYIGMISIYSNDPDSAILNISLSGNSRLAEITVYPNPYVPSNGHNYLNFSNVPAQGKIIVYTISGEKLWTQEVSSEGIYQWDTKIDSGKLLSSGFYYYLVKDKDGKVIKKNKFSIIR